MQGLHHRGPPLGSQPTIQWNGEPLLAGQVQVGGEETGREVPQQQLSTGFGRLRRIWYIPECELHDPMVQDRCPNLQRRQHTRTIHLGQNVVGQVTPKISPS